MEKRKYTFEDWFEGKIDSDIKQGNISLDTVSNYSFKRDPEYYLNKEGLIEEEEYRLIDKAKEITFFEGSELTVKTLYEKFLETVERSDFPDEYIQEERNDIVERLSKFKKGDIKSVLENQWSASGISRIKYRMYLHLKDEGGIIHISNPSPLPFAESDGKWPKAMNELLSNFTQALNEKSYKKGSTEAFSDYMNSLTENNLYDIRVLKGYLRKVESYYDQLSQLETESKNEYGTHQNNRDWVAQQFANEIQNQPSQNQAVIEVQKKYRERFGFPISPATILRLVGKY